MTTTSSRPTAMGTPAPPASERPVQPAAAITVLVLTAVLSLAALLGPNLAASDLGMDMSMNMTHYMELLAANQPWNLLLFMGVPVVLAETLAITELVLLFRRDATPAWVRSTSRIAGLLAGPVMVAILLHLLLNAVVPLTLTGGWRGPADVIAVGFYLSGAIPLAGITLVELGVVTTDRHQAMKWHAIWIAVFLVVAHVAMIFGMLDPGVLGYVMAHQH
ncbi:MAG TPA: permease [Propionicimonas sp.]|nr:permease [Propionicimonas sp.]